MEIIEKRRIVVRLAFTKTVNILKEEIHEELIKRRVVKDNFEKLKGFRSELKLLDESMIDALIDAEASENSIVEDMENAEKYWDEFIALNRLVPEALNIDKSIKLSPRKSEERALLAKGNFEELVSKEEEKDRKKVKENIPTAAGLFVRKEPKCIFCEKAHSSADCFIARAWSLKDKTAKVRERICCLKCLKPGHVMKLCKTSVRCHECGKSHVVLFCPNLHRQRDDVRKNEALVQSNMAQHECTKTVADRIVINGTTKPVRALVDSGSQKSYILKPIAEEVELKARYAESIAHSLFGGSRTEPQPHNKYEVTLCPLDKSWKATYTFQFLDQKKICGQIPRLPKGPLMETLKQHGIWLSDIGPGCPEIELLIGSDIYGKLLTGQDKQLPGGLTAVQTKLGWTMCGEVESPLQDCSMSFTSTVKAKMDLRMWEFGPSRVINPNVIEDKRLIKEDSPTPVSVLGLRWDRVDDSLMIGSKLEVGSNNPSKREILSVTQSIFDPIGYLPPVLLPVKFLIQQAWASKSSWDAPLPENIRESYVKWRNCFGKRQVFSSWDAPLLEKIHEAYAKWRDKLNILANLKVPRRVGFGPKNQWTMHVCCDASQEAYAAVIFLRCELTEVYVQLMATKSRLSPIKQVTIPRLELLSIVLGARLCQSVVKALELSYTSVHYCTDSSTVLAWICRKVQWGTFVGNRVREIRELTNSEGWSHVPGKENPTDLPSRGCNPSQLLLSTWWEGPEWMRNWPRTEILPDEEKVSAERKRRRPRIIYSDNGTNCAGTSNALKARDWQKARVESFQPSRDGETRVARVKTKSSVLVRPVKNLYPLEVSSDDPVIQFRPRRSGRVIKKPNRLNL